MSHNTTTGGNNVASWSQCNISKHQHRFDHIYKSHILIVQQTGSTVFEYRSDCYAFWVFGVLNLMQHIHFKSWVHSAQGTCFMSPFTLHEHLVSLCAESQQSVWLADLWVASDLYPLAGACHWVCKERWKQACKYSQAVLLMDKKTRSVGCLHILEIPWPGWSHTIWSRHMSQIPAVKIMGYYSACICMGKHVHWCALCLFNDVLRECVSVSVCLWD